MRWQATPILIGRRERLPQFLFIPAIFAIEMNVFALFVHPSFDVRFLMSAASVCPLTALRRRNSLAPDALTVHSRPGGGRTRDTFLARTGYVASRAPSRDGVSAAFIFSLRLGCSLPSRRWPLGRYGAEPRQIKRAPASRPGRVFLSLRRNMERRKGRGGVTGQSPVKMNNRRSPKTKKDCDSAVLYLFWE